jgi:hypothetical protein
MRAGKVSSTVVAPIYLVLGHTIHLVYVHTIHLVFRHTIHEVCVSCQHRPAGLARGLCISHSTPAVPTTAPSPLAPGSKPMHCSWCCLLCFGHNAVQGCLRRGCVVPAVQANCCYIAVGALHMLARALHLHWVLERRSRGQITTQSCGMKSGPCHARSSG